MSGISFERTGEEAKLAKVVKAVMGRQNSNSHDIVEDQFGQIRHDDLTEEGIFAMIKELSQTGFGSEPE